MSIIEPLIAEIEQEAATTRRVLERIPENKLGWKPHPKSMSLGQLALHIAQTPGMFIQAMESESMEVPDFGEPPMPETLQHLLEVHDASVAQAKAVLSKWTDAKAMGEWAVTRGGAKIMAMPRIGFVRMIPANHVYHHRGQLSVYLRLLDIPVPSIYGPSADENPFG